MKLIKNATLILMIVLFGSMIAKAQTSVKDSSNKLTTATMKTYLIERDIPNAGKLTPEQLKSISQKSCSVLQHMGPQIQWIQSYVTGDKIFCVYKAENEDLIREHAKEGGFPANVITEISTTISPATAKQ
ncbi:DUF4242 domain-containing protein [Mucilaginibacter gotjawali]|uniref:Uncharacterized protein n=2 Tax=Mucilaginibacter gotjawali TaxID=1550579 RepID=A0A110B3R9_9SPHI|nr:DUF4242 domain-containing protein [Mucilaginibacter gotjawali]MBB3056593.1 hypothetical protein [Mucilaginibacter gotjawali]BAU52703.1 hypothetical protein MgSA37_00865 [Mucilaginibacter gotjawali]